MAKKLKNNPVNAAEYSSGEGLKFRGFDMPLNAVVFFAIVVLILYMNTLNSPFLFDDIHTIVNNPYITSLKNVPGYFVTNPEVAASKIEHTSWRPLWYLSFALNYHYAGLNPSAYHATNIFIHFMVVSLVYLIVLRLSRGRSKKPWLAALLAALFFAAHPLQTETVSNVVSRSASMTAFFYLLAFYAYDVYRDRGWNLLLAVSAISFCFSVFTKENAVTLPVMIIIYDFSLKDRSDRPLKGFALLMLLASAFTVFRFYIASSTIANALPRNPLHFLMTEVYVVPQYIFKVFIPLNLNIDPDIAEITSIYDPRFFLSFLALVSIFYGLYRVYKVDRFTGFFTLWFFVALIPETTMPLADFMAERRTYLPLVGPAIIFGCLLERAITYRPAKGKSRIGLFWGSASALAVLLVFGFLTVERNRDYSSETAFWAATLKNSPNKSRVIMALGVAYWKEDKLDEAEKYLRKALAADPDNAYAHYNLSLVLKEKNQLDEALRHNLAALDLLPGDEVFLTGLGTLYDDMKLYDKAVEALVKAIKLKPDYELAHEILGSIYISQKKLDEAIREFKVALELSPHSTSAHNNLGSAYELMGKYEMAGPEYKEALRLNPADPLAHYNLAVVYNKTGDKKGAVEHYREYLKYTPDAPNRKAVEGEIERLSGG